MVSFTKQAILDGFTNLLKTKSFSKITIREIAAECGISRMTFYYHFDDIYDMIDWAMKEKLKKAVDTNFTYATWVQGFGAVFHACLLEKNFFLKVFPSIDLRRIQQYLYDIARGFIFSVIDEKSKELGIEPDEESRNMVCEIYGYAMVGLFLNWISKGMKEDPDALVKRFSITIKGTLELSLLQAIKQNDCTKSLQ